MTGHAAHPQPLTVADLFALAAIIAPIVVLLVWTGLARSRRARTEVRRALENSGYHIVRLDYRWLRQGPLFWSSNQHTHLVYRVVVHDAEGRERMGWARWGRTWLFNPPDKLEFRWDQ